MKRKRINLLHAYAHSMGPIHRAFVECWPEAQTVNLLDESLYADVSQDGTMAPSVPERIRSLLAHCVLSGANGVVFTGSTFGPAVDEARADIAIPVLKADEAMAEAAANGGRRILVVVTAARAVGVIKRNIEAAAARIGTAPDIDHLVIADAKAAISAGDMERHDGLVGDALESAVGAGAHDTIVVGQISMVPAMDQLPRDAAARILSSPDASVAKMRELLEGG